MKILLYTFVSWYYGFVDHQKIPFEKFALKVLVNDVSSRSISNVEEFNELTVINDQ